MAATSASTSALLTTAAILLMLAQLCPAQNYHFSNGWHAGKKRSDLALGAEGAADMTNGWRSAISLLKSDLGIKSGASRDSISGGAAGAQAAQVAEATDLACDARLQTLALITKLLQEEASKIQRSCQASKSSGWKELMEASVNRW